MACKTTLAKISIVMPVLNEAKELRNTLGILKLSENEELIIVDGGSSDETMSIAGEFTDKVFKTKTGRANTMNYGAEKATGDIILFLHADCALPDNAFNVIRETLNNKMISAGAFYLSINSPGLRFRMIESAANLRSHATSLLYGDQGIFMRRSTFKHVGGYADIPLMEDIEISQRLRKTGKLALTKPAVKASPRRWLEEGVLYTTLRDWTIAFSYTFLKISPVKLIRHYGEVR
jgi:rSAM/selenodomain-associated transferase 2